MAITAADVRAIVETDLLDAQINAFITTADQLVTDELAGEGLGSARLDEIRKYLAAHFLSHRDQRAASEAFGNDYRVSYQGKTGMKLEATFYGQTAMMLDTTGKLEQMSKAGRMVKLRSYVVQDVEDND